MIPIFADIALNPGSLLAWILVGLIAGWMGGQIMEGGGFGAIGDLAIGLIGSVVGGFVVSLFDQGVAGFWGSLFVSILGACVFLGISRVVVRRRAV